MRHSILAGKRKPCPPGRGAGNFSGIQSGGTTSGTITRLVEGSSMRKKNVLIISTYDTHCGIATFTSFVKAQLSDFNDIEIAIAQLDQDILKRYPTKFGDRAIREIIDRSKSFDVVNIQMEWGILGKNTSIIIKRFKWLLEGCDNIILTLHTPIVHTSYVKDFIYKLCKLRIFSAAKIISLGLIKQFYENRKISLIKNTAKRLGDRFHIIVHTKRERKFFECLHGLKNIHDHPLSNMRADWLERVTTEGESYRKMLQERFGEDAKLIGCFGFISPYKGFETAIDAMRLLPERYKLLLYGAIHPESIQKNIPINSYLAKLLQRIGYQAGSSKFSGKQDAPSSGKAENIFFMGSPDDYDFLQATYSVDICIFPYLETGQSASGPVSIAVELEKDIFLSDTHTFQELSRYFPKSFKKFDIGNYVQLAQLIQNDQKKVNHKLDYGMETQRNMYKEIIDQFAQGNSIS